MQFFLLEPDIAARVILTSLEAIRASLIQMPIHTEQKMKNIMCIAHTVKKSGKAIDRSSERLSH